MIDFIAPLAFYDFTTRCLPSPSLWKWFLLSHVGGRFSNSFFCLFSDFQQLFLPLSKNLSRTTFGEPSETQKKSKNLSELAQCNFNWCLYRNDFYQTNHKIRFSLFWIKACGKSIIKNKYHRLYIIYCVVWFKVRLCMRASKARLHVFERNSNKNSNNSGRNNSRWESKETLTVPEHSRTLGTRRTLECSFDLIELGSFGNLSGSSRAEFWLCNLTLR